MACSELAVNKLQRRIVSGGHQSLCPQLSATTTATFRNQTSFSRSRRAHRSPFEHASPVLRHEGLTPKTVVRCQGGGDGAPGPEEPKKSGGGDREKENPSQGSGPPQRSGVDSSGALDVLAKSVSLPRPVLDTLRDQVFGFDSFFVTDQEPYQGGVLFKGNLRVDSAIAYEKINKKLQAKFGDKYLLYLLVSPEDERPVAVVVPKESLELPPPAVPDSVGAAAFGFVSLLTVLLSNSPSPEFGFLPSAEYLLGPLLEGVPATGVFALGLLAHEAGHYLVARGLNIQLALPYFIPSTQLGSFGGITRIKSVVKRRTDLVEVAAAGPLLGTLVSLSLVALTLALLHPDAEQGIVLQASAFQDSFLVGSIAKLILGDRLVEGAEVAVSPLTLAAWSALLANAINTIPAGELDGGRIALGLFGRKGYTRLSIVALVLLGLTGIFNDTALYWVVLIYFLQRGPIAPQSDELSDPSDRAKVVGALALVLGALIYFPLPISF